MIIAGIDEVGRGCLAGPVVAAAVVLPRGYKNASIKDSKRIPATQREVIATIIKRDALAYAIAEVSVQRIDEINILNATFEAMHAAIDRLHITPDLLLVDGNKFNPYKQIPHRCVVGGDEIYSCISAASVIAKAHRDALMTELAKDYPVYQWQQNKGYATLTHRKAIVSHGKTVHHRLTFTTKV